MLRTAVSQAACGVNAAGKAVPDFCKVCERGEERNVCVYVYMCVCACVCVTVKNVGIVEEDEEEGGDE